MWNFREMFVPPFEGLDFFVVEVHQPKGGYKFSTAFCIARARGVNNAAGESQTIPTQLH